MTMNILFLLTLLPFLCEDDQHDEISNSILVFEYNMDKKGVVQANHFGHVSVDRPNELKLPPEKVEAIAASLKTEASIDHFLAKAACPARCLVVYTYLNQTYPDKKLEILMRPFWVVNVNKETHVQGVWIDVKTPQGLAEVFLTPSAFGQIMNQHWREFLLGELKPSAVDGAFLKK